MSDPATTLEAKRLGTFLRVILRFALGFALLLGAITAMNWWRDPARHLRAFASNVHDYASPDFNFTGDFTRFIRADCTEADFHRFARQEGLTTQLTEDAPKGVMNWPRCNQPWWTPPASHRGAYYSYRDGGACHIMAHSEGHLYYAIIKW